MTTRLAGRVKRLEFQAHLNRPCRTCHGRGRISIRFENDENYWGDERREAGPCPECGLEWIINIEYEKLDPLHYRIPMPDWLRKKERDNGPSTT